METIPYAQWHGNLEEVISALNFLTKQTEDQFLSIGSRLNDFYNRSGDISGLASSLLDAMLGEGMTGTTGDLENILNRMNAYLEQTDAAFKGSLRTLDDVQGMVHASRAPLESFKKIIMKLKILSISTKIESAQLNNNNGFSTLADDVEKLSILIHEKCKNISDNAGALCNIIEQTLSRMYFMKERQHSQVGDIFSGIQSGLSTLAAKHERSSRAAGEISERLTVISDNIGKVVMSMQFHDITRQQLEHVAAALESLIRYLESECKGKEDLSPRADETIKKIVIETGDLSELQSVQMNDARNKFVSAVENIKDSLSGIVTGVVGISEQAKEVTGTADLAASSFFTNVESGISRVISSLQDNARASQELSGAIDSLLATVNAMSEFVDDIEEIGGEIELIAVNARIKAAHTGDEGAPLGVIAEATQKLSIEASAQKTAISNMLRGIVSKTGKLHEDMCADANERSREVDDTAEGLKRLLVSLHNVHDDILHLLGKIDRACQALARDIQDSVAGITIHRQFEETLAGIMPILHNMIGESRQLVPVDDMHNRKDVLVNLKQHYTMQSEYDIHETYESSKVIDLKKVKAQKAGVKGSAGKTPGTDIANDYDYGDNVELF
ncbi:MAG: Methyl-accepting chemotaxis protein 2 [Syntrophorhabdus sp. PtaU1.Bin058]|nr:MAG: Methyl-accepting chemotaxis protein 2 [Syntrophorhabdus sp. PtaU1.Bin058]